MRAKDGAKKLMDLGMQFIPMEQIIKDAVESLKSKGLISWMKLQVSAAVHVPICFINLNKWCDTKNLSG